MEKQPTHIKTPKRATITELVKICDLTDVSLRKHIRKANIEHDEKKRYDVSQVLNAIVKHHKEDARFRKKDDPKYDMQVLILQAKYGEMVRDLLPVGEVEDLVKSICLCCVNGFIQAENAVESLCNNDAKIMIAVKSAFDRTRSEIAKEIEGINDRRNKTVKGKDLQQINDDGGKDIIPEGT